MKVLCGFSSQVVHSLLCVCPLQHQPPAVQMGTVAQCRERFLWETSTKSKLKMYWTHWTGSMLISCFTGDCLTVKSKKQKETETDAPTLASCLVRKSMKPKPRWAPPIPFFGRRTVFSSPNVLTKRNNTCTLDQISHDYFTKITRVPSPKPRYYHSHFC